MLVGGPETVETMAALASGAMGKDVFAAWLRRYARNEYFIYFRYLTRFYHEYDTRPASLPSMIRPTADLLQGDIKPAEYGYHYTVPHRLDAMLAYGHRAFFTSEIRPISSRLA
ncbi:hypothetical protein [Komagataeibacter oboediens]|uniref:hypothetical protein n=2 Tax=Komagataeibacter oboediens TaxID=65958 RepID=UPI001C2C095C|nr:hypothetical protein [Komagataeibacter oboediens]MCK9819670.1 hypothetical protein [Komagataeibacter oboediens]